MSSDQPMEGAQPVAYAHGICAGWKTGKTTPLRGSLLTTQSVDKK